VGLPGGEVHCTLLLHDTLLVGTPCGIYRSLDNGNTFAPHSRRMPAGVVHSLLDNGQLLFACVLKKGVYTSTDRGVTWHLSLPGAFLRGYNGRSDIEQAGSAIVVRAYYVDSLYYTVDNGQHWSARHVGNSTLDNIHGANGKLYAWSYNGAFGATNGLYRSADLGATWQLCSGVTEGALHVRAVGNTLYAFGDRTYRSTDDGLSFTELTSGAPFGASFLTWDGTRFYMMGEGNINVGRGTWQPGQASWQTLGASLPDQGTGIGLFAHNGRITASRVEHVYTSADGGANWTQNALNGMNTTELMDLHADAAGAVAVTLRKVLRANEGASSWTVLPENLSEDIYTVMRLGNTITVGTDWISILRNYYSINENANWTATDYVDQYIYQAYDLWTHQFALHDTIVSFSNSGAQPIVLFDATGTLLLDISAGFMPGPFYFNVVDVTEHNGDLYAAFTSEDDSTRTAVRRLDLPDATSWTNVYQANDEGDEGCRAIGSFGGRLFLGVGFGGGVRVSDNDGTSWTDLSAGLHNVTPQRFINANGYFFMASDNGVYYLNATGDGWVDITGDLMVGDVAEVCISPGTAWARLTGGGAWSMPLNGNVSVPESSTANTTLLWPNPAHDVVSVQLGGPATQVPYTMVDHLGRTVQSGTVHSSKGTLTLRGLTPGAYEVRFANGAQRAKLLVR
jgi:hypothetical protein